MNQQTPRVVRKAVTGIFSALALCLLALFTVTSCTPTTAGSGSDGSGQLKGYNPNNPAVKARNAKIATEQRGNYYIGRRWWVNGTRFWGYIRKPGEPWINSKLVIMDETVKHQPDRVPEEGAVQNHGFDHNYEYRIYGSLTGRTAYDPNSDFILPVFKLTGYELISSSPGFVFYPGESYSPNRLPAKHPATRR